MTTIFSLLYTLPPFKIHFLGNLAISIFSLNKKKITTYFRGQILASIQSALLRNSRLRNGIFAFMKSCVTGSVLCLPLLMEGSRCCECTRLGHQLTRVSQEQVTDIQYTSKLERGLEFHHG